MTTQFVIYNIVVLLVIAHFLDSAKEREWTDELYRGSYLLWIVTSLILMAVALAGIVPAYNGTALGDIFSWIVALGGLGAAGYHIPMHRLGKSEVCNNRFSYVVMLLLSVACVSLIVATVFEM